MTIGMPPQELVQTAQDPSVGGRLQGVDVLRGLAAILVVLDHIHLRFQINRYGVADLLPDSLGKVLFRSGYYSVIYVCERASNFDRLRTVPGTTLQSIAKPAGVECGRLFTSCRPQRRAVLLHPL